MVKLKKRRGKARILASVVVENKKEQKIRIVFVRHRHRHKRKWLAILSTKIDLAEEEIVLIYSKRWDIDTHPESQSVDEVFKDYTRRWATEDLYENFSNGFDLQINGATPTGS